MDMLHKRTTLPGIMLLITLLFTAAACSSVDALDPNGDGEQLPDQEDQEAEDVPEDSGGVVLVMEREPNNRIDQAQQLGGDLPLTLSGRVDVEEEGDVQVELPGVPGLEDLGLEDLVDIDDLILQGEDDIEDLFQIDPAGPGLQLQLSGFDTTVLLLLGQETDEGFTSMMGAVSGPGGTLCLNVQTASTGRYFIGVSVVDADPNAAATTAYTLFVTAPSNSECTQYVP